MGKILDTLLILLLLVSAIVGIVIPMFWSVFFFSDYTVAMYFIAVALIFYLISIGISYYEKCTNMIFFDKLRMYIMNYTVEAPFVMFVNILYLILIIGLKIAISTDLFFQIAGLVTIATVVINVLKILSSLQKDIVSIYSEKINTTFESKFSVILYSFMIFLIITVLYNIFFGTLLNIIEHDKKFGLIFVIISIYQFPSVIALSIVFVLKKLMPKSENPKRISSD